MVTMVLGLKKLGEMVDSLEMKNLRFLLGYKIGLEQDGHQWPSSWKEFRLVITNWDNVRVQVHLSSVQR
jgi:hypothetical protein